MDAFFVRTNDFNHPYFLRLWCPSTFEGTSLLLTFDGVKIRLLNFLTNQTIKEVDFLNHQALSYVISIYHPGYPSKAIFLLIRDRRNIWAYDDQLSVIPSLSMDTSLIVLAMAWSQQNQILYISGNFGWMRALRLKVTTSISGTVCEWIPVWTKHDSGQWMQHLALDEHRDYLFGASGTDIFMWSLSDGQLIIKFDSKHAHAITRLKYSPDHLILFSASSDGTIKLWRIFERKPDIIRTIKQAALGPMLVEIDSSTLITVSYERIIRRYNMMNGNVLGSLDLEPSVSIETKNIDMPLKMNLVFTENSHGKREWLFESENNNIALFEVHYAPRELAICCDAVSHLIVDSQCRIFALCRNNIMHMLYTDAHDGRTLDIDTMPLMNDPDSTLNPSVVLHVVFSNGFIYFAFESGEIKALNVNTFQLFEMHEPDLGSTITALCPSHKILSGRHSYCPARPDISTLLLSCSSNGGFTIHCPVCYNFIASWKLQNEKVIQMKEVPESNLIAVIDTGNLRIYKEIDNLLKQVCAVSFDEYEHASCFAFASERLIIVGMVSGKGSIYDLNEDNGGYSLKQRITIRMHEYPITTILSCRDLKKISECEKMYDSFGLDGIICSIGSDDTLKIIDCYTGITQYYCDLPVHTYSHDAVFVFQAKIMLAIAIDQNIRLFDWPHFERILPTPPESPKTMPPPKRADSDSENREEEDNDEEESSSMSSNFRSASYYGTRSSSANIALGSISLTSGELIRGSVSRIDRNGQPFKNPIKNYPDNNDDIKASNPQNKIDESQIPTVKKQRVDLVFENGFPKLVFEGEAKIEEKKRKYKGDNNDEEEEEEEEEYKEEVEITEELYLQDLIRPPTNNELPLDEDLENNRRILEKILLDEPEIAEMIRKKRIKKIARVREDEIAEEEFFDYLLSPDIKNFPSKKKKKWADQARASTPIEFKLPSERPEKIPRIGCQKSRVNTKKKKFLIIEFENGKKLKTSEITMDIMQQISMVNTNKDNLQDLSSGFSPGWVFQNALADLARIKQHASRPLIVREQELVALPILTLTSGGVNIGANYHRFFRNKPYKKFVEDISGLSFVTTAHDGDVKKNEFMHWEGVNFGRLAKKSHVIGMSTVIENEVTEEEEDQLDDGTKLINEIINRAKRRPAKTSEETDDYVPFDPMNFNSDNPQSNFNFFEKNDPLSKAIVAASPSISTITSMINDNDENPLYTLIKNTPAFSPEQIHARLTDDRLSSITQWQRSTGDDIAFQPIANQFTFEGLSEKIREKDLLNGVSRPASPRPMDALAELTKRMQIGQPLLEVISEDYFGDINSSSSTDDDDDDDDQVQQDIEAKQTPVKLTRTQSIIQEHLQRNDFKALRDALDEVGLLCNEGLIDLPRWQPSVHFKTRHQKDAHRQLKNKYLSDDQLSTDDQSSVEASTNQSKEKFDGIKKDNINENDNKSNSKSSFPKKNKRKTYLNEFGERVEVDEIDDEDEDEEDENLDDIMSSITKNKTENPLRKGSVSEFRKQSRGKIRKFDHNGDEINFDSSSRSSNSNNSTVSNKRRMNGLSRDGKRLYKVPKDKLRLKKKESKIKQIRIHSDLSFQPRMKEIIPGEVVFKSSKIKNLLKDRPDHIDIDFGDPNLYKAGAKKYYVKSLLKEGPRFAHHTIGTKNPLLMAHGSDDDDDAIYDESIRKVNTDIKTSNSFGCMPLPRLSPREESSDEDKRAEEEEEEEMFLEEDYDDDDESEYESEYYESEDETGKKVRKKRKLKKKRAAGKRRRLKKGSASSSNSSIKLRRKKKEEPKILLKNPLVRSQQTFDEISKNKKGDIKSSEEEENPNLIIGTLKSKARPQTRNRRNIKKNDVNKKDDDGDILKEMEDILKLVDKNHHSGDEYGEEEEEEEEAIIEEVQTIIEEETAKTPEKKKKKKSRRNSVKKPKQEAREEEDDTELLESLMKQTTSGLEPGLGDLLNSPGYGVKKSEINKTRPSFLGRQIMYNKMNEFQSVKRSRVISVKKNGIEFYMKPRPGSTSKMLIKRKKIERKKMYMLGNTEMIEAPGIFLSYDAQTLWDNASGKCRRSSLDAGDSDRIFK